PATAYLNTNGTGAVPFLSHPNDLMNPGRSVPSNSGTETTRQFISDLDAKILADAYGYTVVLPSSLNNAYVSLDEQTGTLLVQVQPNAQVDSLSIHESFGSIITNVNGHFEVVPGHLVQRIVIAGNRGADTVSVTGNHPVTGLPLQALRLDAQYVVSSNQDLADAGAATRDFYVDHSTTIPGLQVSLRSAMLDALAPVASSPITSSYIYVPRGAYTLTLPTVNSDDGANEGDLDVTSGNNVTILGSGPGATIINGGEGATINERVFDVRGGGQLNLERLTITGGASPTVGEYGGGIRISANSAAQLDQVVVTHNSASSGAGGIFNGGYLSIANSVIANNTVTQTVAAGAPVWHTGGMNSAGTLVLSKSIVANNTALNTNTLGHDIIASTPMSGLGYNRIESAHSDVITAFNNASGSPGGVGNHFGAVGAGRIVTSLADAWYGDARAMTLRNAIHEANLSTTVDDEIWLPGWRFMLTRGRLVNSLGQYAADTSGLVNGDIDVADTLTLRGVNSSTAIGMLSSQTADRVFELLGDYNNDGYVNGTDFVLWQQTLGSTTDFRADGNDDGLVDSTDYTVWSNHIGNSLVLVGLSGYNGTLLT
ncbi:MAG TPA: dockerin type I domain-containing protein, partial [Lacipirellulaceae bacterium]|nr:dockerin type I domain-containing protein [Lacipirellulaceae bacterium]